MPKHTFTETTEVNNKVFFEGEAEISDADVASLGVAVKNAKTANASAGGGAFPEDYPGYEVLGQVEGMTPERIAAMTDEEVLAINGIGPSTLKQIRSYGK